MSERHRLLMAQNLSNEADRKEHAKRIAQGLKPFWKAVKGADLA